MVFAQTHTTLIAVKTFFIVKHHLLSITWIHINSHNLYTYVLKCIFWGSSYFGAYGCWLVWLLLYIFMVADWLVWLLICLKVLFSRTEPEKNIFLIKVYTTSKAFVILTCINTNLKCIKDWGLLWIKQTDGPGLCFKDQYKVLQTSRKNCQLPGRPW